MAFSNRDSIMHVAWNCIYIACQVGRLQQAATLMSLLPAAGLGPCHVSRQLLATSMSVYDADTGHSLYLTWK